MPWENEVTTCRNRTTGFTGSSWPEAVSRKAIFSTSTRRGLAVSSACCSARSIWQAGADRVHVGNIARSGVGSQALDLILSRVLPRYPRLQTIIVLVGASDVLQWLERGAPPAPPPPPRTSDIFRCHPELRFGVKINQLALTELLAEGSSAVAASRAGSPACVPLDWPGKRHAAPGYRDPDRDA